MNYQNTLSYLQSKSISGFECKSETEFKEKHTRSNYIYLIKWNKPSQSIKGWDTAYPKDTYFTWWGCIDSIITPEQSLYNPARIGQLPFYQSIKISFRKIDSSNAAEDLLVISIKDDNGKGWGGVSFLQQLNGLFDPAVPSYYEWIDNRMKLIISEDYE
tara:strand:+ start:609 stop:1085 length:477 start_codon:yes stop_codon:yes gene_type:complete